MRGQLQVLAEARFAEKQQRGYAHHIKRYGKCGCLFKRRLVYTHDIHRIGQCREEYKHRPHEAECGTVGGFIQQAYARSGHGEAYNGEGFEFFFEKETHYNSHQQRVYKQYGGCYACVHIIVTFKESPRCSSHHHPHKQQRHTLGSQQFEALPP